MALAVAAISGGTGLGASLTSSIAGSMGLAGNAVAVAAIDAGVTALLQKTTIAMINNQGDLAAVLAELGSEASLRSLVGSILTAGLTQGALDIAQVGAVTPGATFGQNFANAAQTNLIKAAIKVGVSTTVEGQPLDQTLLSTLRLAVADTIGTAAATEIGNLGLNHNLGSGDITKIALHAAAGCAVGAIGSDNCLAGAIAAGLQEILGAPLSELVKDPALEGQIISLVGGVAGALSVGSAEAINAGASIAHTAHAYNYLAHEELVAAKAVAEQLRQCLDAVNCAPTELERLSKAYNEFVDLSADNTAALTAACSQGVTATCTSRIADLISFVDAADWENQIGLPAFGSAGGFATKQSIFSYDAILAEHYRGVLDGSITPALATQNALRDIAQRTGGVNAFLNAIGVVGGIAVCASGAGTAACVAGALTALNSANHLVGDVQQTLTGNAAHSALEQALRASGYSAEDAALYQSYIDAGVIAVDVVIAGGVAAYRISVSPAKLSPADSALAKINGQTYTAPITSNGTANAATGAQLNQQLLIDEIVGHSFYKHVLQQGEFQGLGIRTISQFRDHVQSVINSPSSIRYYKDGRQIYLQESTGTVVVRNPNGTGESTAFQPRDWNAYVSSLPKQSTPYQ